MRLLGSCCQPRPSFSQWLCGVSTRPSLCRGIQSAAASTERPRYRHIDEVEDLNLYERGGYHPITVGDSLQYRYEIVHKLGFGSFSTLWLARDGKLSKYVAIKAGIAASDHTVINTLNRLLSQASSKQGLGASLLPHVLDHFDAHGPNGIHPCLVTARARCSLADAVMAGGHAPFQTDVARSLAAQLALAMAYIHSAGFVHGDLHIGNLLLQLPKSMECSTDKQLYDQFGPPEPELVVREDGQPLLPGVPSHVYSPIWMRKPSDELLLSDAKLLLTDFGTAYCPHEEHRFESRTPLQIRPPEVRFEPTKPLSFASDIWSLGCVMWAILGTKPFLGSWLFGPESAVSARLDALGLMPNEWWDEWEAEAKAESFDGNGRPKPGRGVWTFEQRFEDSIQQPRREDGMEIIIEEEKKAIFQMIRGMLKFRLAERLTAKQVLDTEWMRKWALPEAEKSWGIRGRFLYDCSLLPSDD